MRMQGDENLAKDVGAFAPSSILVSFALFLGACARGKCLIGIGLQVILAIIFSGAVHLLSQGPI